MRGGPTAVLIAVLISIVMILLPAACGPELIPNAAVSPAGTPGTHASAPRISPPPVIPPSPPGTNLPAFACADASGGKTGVANVITARTSEQTGYDRFVLQFDGIVPTYTVVRQAKPVFATGATGQQVTLSGTAGILITVHSATGNTTFTGSNDIFDSDFAVIKEARQLQDFEGTVAWGLGISNPTCMRVFTLTDPARLVVDLQTPSR